MAPRCWARFRTCRAAEALAAESQPDCVLLDVDLKGHFVFELAEELIGRGVPSIFTTGYDASFLPRRRCGGRRACKSRSIRTVSSS